MANVLNGTNFVEVNCTGDIHPIIANENSIKRYINTYVKPMIDEDELYKYLPSGSTPGKLFGFCKVWQGHKENFMLAS